MNLLNAWMIGSGLALASAVAARWALEEPRSDPIPRPALAAASVPGPAPAPAPSSIRALYGLTAPRELAVAHTALVLVDFQEEFFSGRLPLPDGPEAVRHAAELLRWARDSGIRVVHVRNVSSRPDSPLFAPQSPEVRPVAALMEAPGEMVIVKSIAGAFSRTDLEPRLRALGIDTLIVTGLMTHWAVAVTAIDALVLGYKVLIAADATATRALPGAGGLGEVDHQTLQRAALAMLGDRAADVLESSSIEALGLVR